MRIYSACVLSLFVGSTCLPVYAQELEDLIVPVVGQERADVARKSDFSLREKLYLVDNYRIVKINDKLLYGEKKFKISLIGNTELVVETTSVEQSAPGAISWQGVIVPSSQPRYEITSQPIDRMPAKEAEDLYKAMFGISMDLMEWDRNNQTGEVRLLMDRSQSESTRPAAWQDFNPNAFRTVEARFTAIGTDPRGADKTYRIEPLEDSDEFHVLYEESRLLMESMRIDTPYDESSEKDRRDKQVQLEYQEFLDALRKEKAAQEQNKGESQ